MTTGKTIALTIWTFVDKVMFLLFNTLSNFVITFLSRSKCLWISWPQSPSTVTLEPKKRKFVTASIFPPSICHQVMGQEVMILVFWKLNFKPTFFTFLFQPHQRSSLVLLCFLLLELCVSHSVVSDSLWPMDCSLSGSSLHGILQARVLGWVAIPFFKLEWYQLHNWGFWYFSWQSWFQLVIHLVQHFAWSTLNIS